MPHSPSRHLWWPALCPLGDQEINVINTNTDLLFPKTIFFLLKKNIVMHNNLGYMVLLPLLFVRKRKRGSEWFTDNYLKLQFLNNLLLTTLDWNSDYFQFAQVCWSAEIMYLTQQHKTWHILLNVRSYC